MPSSLGLQGDLDDIEMLQDVEEAFGFQFADEEISRCRTVGDLFEFIEARLPSDRLAGGCATAMAFYRLRRAFQPRVSIKLRPKTPISAFAGVPVREMHRIIKRECDLRPPMPYVSAWGCAVLMLVIALPVSAFAMGLDWCIAVLSALPAIGIYRFAPIRLPDAVVTFGDLVELVSSRSIGALAQQGARLRVPEAWDAFRDVLADHTSLSRDAIAADTLLLHPKVANS
jgi:hypothetical protein